MSEVNGASAQLMAQGSSVVADVASGEIVGGLSGLRELIRAKQTQLSRPEATDEVVNATRDIETKPPATSRKKRRRGKRNKDRTAAKAEIKQSQLDLPFQSADIVYGEIMSSDAANKDRVADARLYVALANRLYIYTKSVYPHQADDYCRLASRMLNGDDIFATIKAGKVQLFINLQADLTIGDNNELIYQGVYRIAAADPLARSAAVRLLQWRNQPEADDEIIGAYNFYADAGSGDKKIDKATKEEIMDKHEVIDKVLQVQQVAKRTNEQGKITPVDAMEVFLTLGEATTKLLQKVLNADKLTADSLVDQLRLMHALGEQQENKTYPILINGLSDLGSDVGYTLQSQVDNFRSAVHQETVRGKKLVYDLDELFMVKAADEYVEQLAAFCRASSSRWLKKLWSRDGDVVKVSTILQTISADNAMGGLNVADYQLFHQYVTQYMLSAGWLIDNPTDGYPWLQFQVEHTNGLKIDTMRYLLTNLNWICSVYNRESLASLSRQIAKLDVPTDMMGAGHLRDSLVKSLDKALAQLDEIKVANGQMLLADETERPHSADSADE